MPVSRRILRSAAVGLIGSGAMAGAMLFGGAVAFAEPTPEPTPAPAPAEPAASCTAGDLAIASGAVGTAMGDYLFSHPDVNNFFTSLRGLPSEEVHDRVTTYMDANPQTEAEITGIRQPLSELRSRCDLPPGPMGS
jgi:hemophore-related protein